MKLVTAIIQPHRLEEVRVALNGAGVKGITVTETSGYGRQKGHTEVYRGAEYVIDLLPKMRVEVLCEDADTKSIIDTIVAAAQSGAIGDGKVWTTKVDDVVRVRTGERGSAAI
jgi:nitrogen regulatory protein P-II 1